MQHKLAQLREIALHGRLRIARFLRATWTYLYEPP